MVAEIDEVAPREWTSGLLQSAAGDKAADFVNSKDVDNVYMVDYVKVTPDNANDILAMLG